MLGNDEGMNKRWEDIIYSFFQAGKLNVSLCIGIGGFEEGVGSGLQLHSPASIIPFGHEGIDFVNPQRLIIRFELK